jgi:hypothetical protein
MLTLMDYCLGRLSEGWAIGQPDDWVFIDWVDFPMHKRGIVCFEQILFCKSLETMQLCKDLVGPLSDLQLSNLHLSYPNVDYGAKAAELRSKIDQTFWSPEAHAYLHALEPLLTPLNPSEPLLTPLNPSSPLLTPPLVLLIDDAIDTGATIQQARLQLLEQFPGITLRVAVITVTTPHPICDADFCLYHNRTLCRFPWSNDYR